MDPQMVDYYNAPVKVEDAASMLRKRVHPNDRPYVAETTKLNNRMVDDWKEKVLRKISSPEGTIPSGKVWKSWQLYEEGKAVEQYIEMRNKGMLISYPIEVVEFWRVFFEKSS